MDSNIIFVFTGTGNCLDIARNIGDGLGGADIVRIRKGMKIPPVSKAKRVGFVFPCYAGGAPEDVFKLAMKLKLRPGTYTFGVTSCAAYPGTGLAKLNRIIPLRYWSVITHHCSCIWLFPHKMMMPMLTVGEAMERSKDLSADIARDILDGKVSSRKPPFNLLNVFENMAWPLIAKKKIAAFKVNDNCIGCGQCASICPRDNITISDGKAHIGADCAQCLSCLQYCPKNAISIGTISDKREHYHNPKVKAADLAR